jgi:hypothetical protein
VLFWQSPSLLRAGQRQTDETGRPSSGERNVKIGFVFSRAPSTRR